MTPPLSRPSPLLLGYRRWPRTVTALVAGLLLSSAALAAPVVLVETRVAQYRTAAEAARRHLSGAQELDPGDPGADAKLRQASVIVAVGQKALQQARAAAPNVPIVFCMVLGVTPEMLAANVTGVPLEADPAAVLEHIRAVSPLARRVGVIHQRGSGLLLIEQARRIASSKGVTLVERPVASAAEVKGALSQLAGTIDVLWLPPDPKLYSKDVFAFLLASSAERRLPLIGFLESFTQAGALASVSSDYGDIGARTGKLAAEILARGDGRRLPVPPPVFAPGVLTVNLKTASALGITVSAAAIAEAKHVFR